MGGGRWTGQPLFDCRQRSVRLTGVDGSSTEQVVGPSKGQSGAEVDSSQKLSPKRRSERDGALPLHPTDRRRLLLGTSVNGRRDHRTARLSTPDTGTPVVDLSVPSTKHSSDHRQRFRQRPGPTPTWKLYPIILLDTRVFVGRTEVQTRVPSETVVLHPGWADCRRKWGRSQEGVPTRCGSTWRVPPPAHPSLLSYHSLPVSGRGTTDKLESNKQN